MRLLTLLPPALLALTTHAIDEPPAASPPTEDPTPIAQLWTATWNTTTLTPYTTSCHQKTTYKTPIYTLSTLYPDLASAAPQLKVFYNKQLYAGSWDGIDVHGGGRELIKMSMADLPGKVRQWLKENGTQRHFSVQGDEVYFAPGAIYPILPLWVEGEEQEAGECDGEFVVFSLFFGLSLCGCRGLGLGYRDLHEQLLIEMVIGVFDDLENYSNEPRDGAVIGKVKHRKTGEKEVEFTVEAMVVKRKGGVEGEEGRDEL
ncbi:hypothetical protein NX059_000021 [Plenodomus lindquistii]|nr:hypothetical protein NX059_000021 [Plenodomus lindquistii]